VPIDIHSKPGLLAPAATTIEHGITTARTKTQRKEQNVSINNHLDVCALAWESKKDEARTHLPQLRRQRPQSHLGWGTARGQHQTKGQHPHCHCYFHRTQYHLRTGRGSSEGSGSRHPAMGQVHHLALRRRLMGKCTDVAQWVRRSFVYRRHQCGPTTRERRAPHLERTCLRLQRGNSERMMKSKSAGNAQMITKKKLKHQQMGERRLTSSIGTCVGERETRFCSRCRCR
jgi:hypothetical protein